MPGVPESLGLDSEEAPHAGGTPRPRPLNLWGWDSGPGMGQAGVLHGEADGFSVSAQP